jgi:hypothetical protein
VSTQQSPDFNQASGTAPPPRVSPAFLRIEDAAHYCSCSAEFLSKETRKRHIAAIKKGRCVFYAVADLNDWMMKDRIDVVN